MPERKQEMIEFGEQHIRDLVHGQAAKLRRLADDLDREADRAKDVASLTQTALHTVAWGVANLNQDQLVSWLSQIAALRAEREEAPDDH